MSAREEILGRIRAATSDVTEADPVLDVPVDWVYGQPTPLPDVLDTFVDNIEEYGARIVRTPASGTSEAIVVALKELGAKSVVVPRGVPAAWSDAVQQAGIEVVRDEPQLTHAELNRVDAVLTGS
ncbi:MAG: lactate utilization protein C, partial [Propionibacteriales bacterium]